MEQNTQEWLEFRRTRIGASDAPIIMDVSPWLSPYELYEQKVNGVESITTLAMERGKELEPIAREMVEKILMVSLSPKVVVNPELPWQIASLDGISDDGKVAVEIKCPTNINSYMKAASGEIPEHYKVQMQHQMSVTGLKKMIYCSYFDGDCELIEVERNESYIQKMIEKEKEFYDMMVNKTPPQVDNRKCEAILENSEEFYNASEKYKELDTAIKLLMEQKEIERETLIKIAKERNIKGNGIIVSKRVVEGKINYKKMPLNLLDDLEKYRGDPTTSWVIRVS